MVRKKNISDISLGKYKNEGKKIEREEIKIKKINERILGERKFSSERERERERVYLDKETDRGEIRVDEVKKWEDNGRDWHKKVCKRAKRGSNYAHRASDRLRARERAREREW